MSDVFYNAMVLREPYSGVEVTVHQLACALAQYGTTPLTVCTPTKHRPIPESQHLRLRTSLLFSRARLLRILWELTVLPALLYRHHATLLHAPAYVAPLAAPCPVVLTIHDLHVMTHPQFCSTRNRLHYSLMIPPSVRKAAAIIVFSPYTRRLVLGRFPEAKDRTVVIPPGLPPTLTRCAESVRLRAARQRYKLPSSFLLFVGDLSSRKNILGLLPCRCLCLPITRRGVRTAALGSHGLRLPRRLLRRRSGRELRRRSPRLRPKRQCIDRTRGEPVARPTRHP